MNENRDDDNLLSILNSLAFELRGGDLTSPSFTREESSAAVRDAYEELKRLRRSVEELREAYSSAVRKLTSLQTGWMDDVGHQPDLMQDRLGVLTDDELALHWVASVRTSPTTTCSRWSTKCSAGSPSAAA